MNEVNEVRVRCTKDGISVEGARDIGSTNDTRAGSLSQFLRIAECWWNTYCEKSPQPDKGWKDICAKCNDGEIEPCYCEFFGEPNGCNSPIYGKHPTTDKSSTVGNAAAMREVLYDIVMLTMKVGYSIHGDVACGIIASKAKHALSAPPRNCDIGTPEEQEKRFENYTAKHWHLGKTAFQWSQMPYEATNEGDAK